MREDAEGRRFRWRAGKSRGDGGDGDGMKDERDEDGNEWREIEGEREWEEHWEATGSEMKRDANIYIKRSVVFHSNTLSVEYTDVERRITVCSAYYIFRANSRAEKMRSNGVPHVTRFYIPLHISITVYHENI